MLLPLATGFIFAFWHSFADSLAWRIFLAYYSPERKKVIDKTRFILKSRSQCEFCGAAVPWWGLIPVLGFFLVARRCAACTRQISWRFPIQEFLAFLFGVSVGLKLPGPLDFATILLVYLLLWIVITNDYRSLLIPTEAILALLALGLVRVASSAQNWQSLDLALDLAVAFTWYFLFHLLRILSGYKMGLADVRLVLALGLLLGHPIALHLPAVASGLAIIFYLLRRNSILIYAPSEKEIPFGVFLSIAYLGLYFLR